MNLDFAAGTDIGRKRENNEDGALCLPEQGMWVVCDGMGGMAAGEQATARALQMLEAQLTAQALETARGEGMAALQTLLGAALQAADADIREVQKSKRAWRGMGCTVVLAVQDGHSLHIVNMGDSRAYLIRSGQTPRLLTKDHTMAAELVRQGDLSPERARHHMLRNHLTSALGHSNPEHSPHFETVELSPDDLVVLCSDGLWDMLEDMEIARIATEAATISEAVTNLIAAANDAGGDDNITVILLKVQE